MKKKKIKSPLIDYFNFSSRERHGVFFLASILILQLTFNFYLKNKSIEIIPADPSVIALINKLMIKEEGEPGHDNSKFMDNTKALAFFNFNPNELDLANGKRLGLSEKQIKVISKYIAHGGIFRVKSDFKKMYCISEKEYENLKPYLLLPDTFIEKKTGTKSRIEKVKLVRIDIQKADSIEFMELHGIGPVLASRIVKYREKLGGFYSVNQLKEVWGINDTLFLSIRENIYLNDTLPFRYIHLNTDSFNILAAHPYIRGKISGLICNYRKQHLSFISIDELKQLPLITEENFLKLAPYLEPIKNLKNE
jgi:competence protein ComEA